MHDISIWACCSPFCTIPHTHTPLITCITFLRQRIENICARGGQHGAKLFSGKIEPSDICQGQLGDCWLMSALACLAHVEGAIQQAFLIREYNAYGRYKIRLVRCPSCEGLWRRIVLQIACRILSTLLSSQFRLHFSQFDKPKNKFVTMTIDDYIPCKKGTCQPCFAKPKGDEAWVLLLEKAMAKFKGSFAALDGGSSLWAFECLTGKLIRLTGN